MGKSYQGKDYRGAEARWVRDIKVRSSIEVKVRLGNLVCNREG